MLPHLAMVKQRVNAYEINDVKNEILISFEKNRINKNKLYNKTIGITVGSRGIGAISEIIVTLVEMVKKSGGIPVLIPSMGTHGGGDIAGQESILRSLGITEKNTGAQIKLCIDTIQLGVTVEGIPVYCNAEAVKVDALIIVNRIKQHTDFTGNIESGICKMLAVGLGSYSGALTTHSYALINGYEKTIKNIANVMIEKLPIFCAVGILENWKGKTSVIEIFPPEEIMVKEPALLRKAKRMAIKLPFKKINILVINEIGKNISGTGMDTKVVGRIMIKGQKEPKTPRIDRIVVLNLTSESHGNAIGIGLADITTRKFFMKTNLNETALNSIASMCPEQGRMPCIADNDKKAIEAGLLTLGAIDPCNARIVCIKNTQELETLLVSESMMDEVNNNIFLETISDPEEICFDNCGNLIFNF